MKKMNLIRLLIAAVAVSVAVAPVIQAGDRVHETEISVTTGTNAATVWTAQAYLREGELAAFFVDSSNGVSTQAVSVVIQPYPATMAAVVLYTDAEMVSDLSTNIADKPWPTRATDLLKITVTNATTTNTIRCVARQLVK